MSERGEGEFCRRIFKHYIIEGSKARSCLCEIGAKARNTGDKKAALYYNSCVPRNADKVPPLRWMALITLEIISAVNGEERARWVSQMEILLSENGAAIRFSQPHIIEEASFPSQGIS